jgi:aryl-alcohol dehydrogenase-like predicted oxidoreductase
VQNHYNLIMREEEREMFLFCREESIAMTPLVLQSETKSTRTLNIV